MPKINYPSFHGKVIRHNNNDWRVIVARLGNRELVEVECIYGPKMGQRIDMQSARTKESQVLRDYLSKNLVH